MPNAGRFDAAVAASLAGTPPNLIHPRPPSVPSGDEESPDVWGFRDTCFCFNERGHVELTGKRYLLSGQEMPALFPWVRATFGVDIDPKVVNRPLYPPTIPPSRASDGLLTALRGVVGDVNVAVASEVRLRRGHGHTQAEMYAIKYGSLSRIPDVVVMPAEEAEVVSLLEVAAAHGACVIPYGGGTNVSEALRCPESEVRSIISVDLARMNRILWIDPISRRACVQAGAVGRLLAGQVREHGFTIGHEPDSIEFSTLGGWIATNASGMKKNRYGNIEELVVDVRAVTPRGVLWARPGGPRESLGSDPRRWVFGSEGALGIITEATIKLFPIPEVQRYGSLLFPDLGQGLAFMYEATELNALPASVRLVDNQQLQLNFVLKPAKSALSRLASDLERIYVTRLKGFDPNRMVACTLVFEGTLAEVADQQRAIAAIARRHDGLAGGAENGERGYMLTYGIAYIRDWILKHWLIAESFETSTAWDRIIPVMEAVKARIQAEHAARGLPGKPFVTARVTQAYPTGVCIYFYFAFCYQGVENPSETYHAIEAAARDAILEAGGSLSHHHGVGTLRAEFLPRVLSDAALSWRAAARCALDPDHLFAAATLGAQSP
ncbi:MAG: FAD-binding oxidoreductase [Polyangiaceae bacterium]|nr:FAD-binding oxidoreductase [Polyangiaceae bacterium]